MTLLPLPNIILGFIIKGLEIPVNSEFHLAGALKSGERGRAHTKAVE